MRSTYHRIVGMAVCDVRGERIGRVADLRAEPMGGKLRVTGLLVGERSLVERLGLHAVELVADGLPGYFVPWTAIARIERAITLRVERKTLERLPSVGRAVRLT